MLLLLTLVSCNNTHTESQNYISPAQSYSNVDSNNNPTLTENGVHTTTANPDAGSELIQAKIAAHKPFFLSYWAGMSPEEVQSVTHQLVREDKVYFLPPANNDFSNSGKVGLDPLYFDFSTTLKTYRLELKFNYFCIGGGKHTGLHSIQLALIPEISKNKSQITNSFTLQEYEEITKLYQEKYGKSISGHSGSICALGAKIKNFEKDNIYVSVQFCGGDDQSQLLTYNAGGGMDCQLIIAYEDAEFYKEDSQSIDNKRQNKTDIQKTKSNATQNNL